MSRWHWQCVILIVSLISTLVRADSLLGFLEEAEQPPDSNSLATNLRVAFRKVGTDWQPVCPSKGGPPWSATCRVPEADDVVAWSIVDSGRIIGVVTTEGWLTNKWYAAEGLLRVTSPTVPRVGSRSLDYAGWPNKEVFRPLVAIHGGKPTFKSKWQEVSATPNDKDQAFRAFKKLVRRIPSCKQDENGKPIGHSRSIVMADVELIKVLRSTDDRTLMGMRVARRLSADCDDLGGFASDAWFVMSPAGGTETLPGRRDDGWPESSMPIEIGDFESDGNETALFWFSGYNEDGYLLFDRNFTRVTRFTWGYH